MRDRTRILTAPTMSFVAACIAARGGSRAAPAHRAAVATVPSSAASLAPPSSAKAEDARPCVPVSPPEPDAEKIRTDSGELEFVGRWILQKTFSSGVRIWEVTASGRSLRYVIRDSNGYERPVGGARIVVHVPPLEPVGPREAGSDLLVVDLDSGRTYRGRGAWLAGYDEHSIFIDDEKSVTRIRAVDLEPSGRLSLDAPPSGGGTAINADVVVAGTTLVSFATGAVLKRDFRDAVARPDGQHVLGCDGENGTLEDIDLATGKVTASFAAFDPQHKPCDQSQRTRGAWGGVYGPDPRYVFWFDEGTRGPLGQDVFVESGDTTTGQIVTKFEDHSVVWGGEVITTNPALTDGDRLCIATYQAHFTSKHCDWLAGRDGSVVASPRTSVVPKPSLASLGFGARLELARAQDPTGNVIGIATAASTGTASIHDIVLAVVKDGRLTRSIRLEPKSVQLDAGPETAPDVVEYAGSPRSSSVLRFFDATRVGFWTPYSSTKLVDIGTGTVIDEGQNARIVGSYIDVKRDPQTILDPLSGTKIELAPTVDEWKRAQILDPPTCARE